MKIYQVVGCLDEGVSRSWHFRAKSKWHVAEYMVRNYQNYPEIFDDLGIETYSRYGEIDEITPEVLLTAIGDSHIDGDSAYGYEIFELEEEDIQTTDNEHLNAPDDHKKWLWCATGDKHFPHRNFALFHEINFYALKNLVKMDWNRYEQEGNEEYFSEWLAQCPEITEAEEQKLAELVEKAAFYRNYNKGFETLAKFVVPLVNLANIDNHTYQVFYDRIIEATINNFLLKGRIDMCIGKGWYEPHNIDFILHHAHLQDHLGHPLSTLLAQMLAAMVEFERQEIRGAYVMNSIWHFVAIVKKSDTDFRLYEYRGGSLSADRIKGAKEIYRFIKAFQSKATENKS
jgi:hypothetical protein